MQDYTIDVHVVSGAGRTTAVAQSVGTRSERPILCRTWRNMTPAAAAYTILLQAIEDVWRYLGDGANITVQISAAPAGEVAKWISGGSGIPELDAQLRRETLALRNEGIGIVLEPGTTVNAKLSQKADMSRMLDM